MRKRCTGAHGTRNKGVKHSTKRAQKNRNRDHSRYGNKNRIIIKDAIRSDISDSSLEQAMEDLEDMVD